MVSSEPDLFSMMLITNATHLLTSEAAKPAMDAACRPELGSGRRFDNTNALAQGCFR